MWEISVEWRWMCPVVLLYVLLAMATTVDRVAHLIHASKHCCAAEDVQADGRMDG